MGISSTALDWLSHCLQDRKQRLVIPDQRGVLFQASPCARAGECPRRFTEGFTSQKSIQYDICISQYETTGWEVTQLCTLEGKPFSFDVPVEVT